MGGTRAYSVQFHVEVEQDTVKNWADISAYRAALEAAMGAGATARLEAHVTARQASFETAAERLYINWMQTAAHV